jgi:hypothetical protein
MGVLDFFKSNKAKQRRLYEISINDSDYSQAHLYLITFLGGNKFFLPGLLDSADKLVTALNYYAGAAFVATRLSALPRSSYEEKDENFIISILIYGVLNEDWFYPDMADT